MVKKNIFILLALFFLLIQPGNALAINTNIKWELKLGAGLEFSPIYSGSNKNTYHFLPFIDATIDTAYGSLRIKNNGGSFTFIRNSYVSVSAGLGFGINRRKQSLPTLGGDIDQNILVGTPILENQLRYFAEIVHSIPFGWLSTAIYFVPIKARYEQSGSEVRPNREYDGVLLLVSMKNRKRLSHRLSFEYSLGAKWMNENYADAYYGVQYATGNVLRYDVSSGLEDIYANFFLTYMFQKHVGVRIVGETGYLLGGAKNSPLTESQIQNSQMAYVFYEF